jgi:hypothetical protein
MKTIKYFYNGSIFVDGKQCKAFVQGTSKTEIVKIIKKVDSSININTLNNYWSPMFNNMMKERAKAIGYSELWYHYDTVNGENIYVSLEELNKWGGLEDIRQKCNTSNPTLKFNVGDRVKLGNITEVTIVMVLDDNQIYYVKCKNVNGKNSQNAGQESIDYRFVPWYSLDIYRTPEEIAKIPRLLKDDGLYINFSQRQVSCLVHDLQEDWMEDEPEYQRGLVWTHEDKEALIESMFNKVDIGKFTIIKNGTHETKKWYEILDGKQRLTTLKDYFENRWAYKGMYFQDLHPRDQYHLTDYVISVGESEGLTDNQKKRLFIKMNTAGHVVDPNHLKKVADSITNED